VNKPRNANNPGRSRGCLSKNFGDVLLSQGVYPQVPSALTGLTAVFGMGTGVTLSLWSPKINCQCGSPQGLQSKHEHVLNKALGRLVLVS
jgi:hypothetical protein